MAPDPPGLLIESFVERKDSIDSLNIALSLSTPAPAVHGLSQQSFGKRWSRKQPYSFPQVSSMVPSSKDEEEWVFISQLRGPPGQSSWL